MLLVGVVLAFTVGAIVWDTAYLRGVDSLDAFVYQCYARGFWQGAQAAHAPALQGCVAVWNGTPHQFHTVPCEYPAPALVIFSQLYTGQPVRSLTDIRWSFPSLTGPL